MDLFNILLVLPETFGYSKHFYPEGKLKWCERNSS